MNQSAGGVNSYRRTRRFGPRGGCKSASISSKAPQMMDLSTHFGPEGWGLIEYQVRRGNDPDLAELAKTLRGKQPVPPQVRSYLGDLIEGKRKRKRGRKALAPSERAIKQIREFSLAERVRRWKRVFEKRYCKPNAYREALEKVEEETGISENTLDKYCYPRKSRKRSSPIKSNFSRDYGGA